MLQQNPLDAIGQQFQGGSFASFDYTPHDQRPRGSRHLKASSRIAVRALR
jgi:hypothetical protein